VPEPGQRTALVTGASGAIGQRLCTRLLEGGWRVIGLSTRRPSAGPWHRYVEADLAVPGATGSLEPLLAGEKVAVVWHLAAKAHALDELRQDPVEYERINAGGTREALRLAVALGARRMVLASSVKAMGEGGREILDESAPPLPATPYGKSKYAAEKVLLEAAGTIEPVVLRFCMVYGQRGHGNMGRMLEAVRRRRFPPFPEVGNLRSYVFVDDAVQACVLAGTRAEAKGGTFLVTDGRQYSTRQLFLAMRSALGMPAPGFAIPLVCFRMAAKVGDFLDLLLSRRVPLDTDTLSKLTDSAAYSSGRISRELGYQPEWSLDRGLAHMAGELRAVRR